MPKKYYMHTLNERPAEFDGRRIVYMTFYGDPGVLARDLKQIRREQDLSRKFREARGWQPMIGSHVRVTVPEEPADE